MEVWRCFNLAGYGLCFDFIKLFGSHSVHGMRDSTLYPLLIKIIPEFKKHWENEDIYKEVDGTFTEHGIMSSFLEYYQHHFALLTRLQITTLCAEFEVVVASDKNATCSSANAICTLFLELLVDTPAGNKIESYLGVQCRKYWNCFKS